MIKRHGLSKKGEFFQKAWIVSVFKNMLFNRGGKMRGGGFLLPLLLILLSGCYKHFEFDTTPLNLPEVSLLLFSPASGYIGVYDCLKDSVIGEDEIAIRRDGKLESARDFEVVNKKVYVTIDWLQAFEKTSNIMRVLNLTTGNIEEVTCIYDPVHFCKINENHLFILTHLKSSEDGLFHNAIYNVLNEEVEEIVKTENEILFAVNYGDSVILCESQIVDTTAKFYLSLYSIKNKIFLGKIDLCGIIRDIPYIGIVKGNFFYIVSSHHVYKFSVEDMSFITSAELSEYSSFPYNVIAVDDKLYISFMEGEKLDVVDLVAFQLEKVISISKGDITTLTYSKRLNRIYGASIDTSRLYIINPDGEVVEREIMLNCSVCQGIQRIKILEEEE